MKHSTRKILDFHYGVHLTVSYHDDGNDPTPYKVHVYQWNPERLAFSRKQIAKFSILPEVLHFVTYYLTFE